MRRAYVASLLTGLLTSAVAMAEAPPQDPFLWLEEVQGEKALAWVRAQNARTLAVLEKDPRFETFHAQALELLTSTDRIPTPGFRAGGVDNFWQDRGNPRGLWRHTSLDGYTRAQTPWETVLDVDALAKAEKANWIWKGSNCLPPADQRCLVSLSNGGKDAVELREFDAAAKHFVEGGFQVPEGKLSASWLDTDTLLVGRDWGGDTLTESGYPFVLKRWKRGTPLTEAQEAFRGERTDVSASPFPLRDAEGALRAVLVNRAVTFFESEYYLLGDAAPVRLPFPRKSSLQAFVDGQVVFTIEEDWGRFKQGALLAYPLAALKADPAKAKPTLLFQPGARQAIESVAATRGRVLVNLYEDVKGALDVYTPVKNRWSRKRLALPKNASVAITATSSSHDRFFVKSQGFLEPTALWLADAKAGTVKKVKSLPARFDGSKLRVDQYWTKSKDGTRIPYFLVRPKARKLDGTLPTLVYGYGGFQVSKPPVYLPEEGKLWMERGGAYVVANIRGGGEFGPRWHQAALREHRQRAFDDFAAVMEDLVRRKVSSPRHLGIYGRSNGGVLTSVAMTQRPDLFNAAVIESPLIDMMRYHKLPAGASWVGEYGDPEVPGDAAFISKYSAYQNLREGVRYPAPYITTNTKDDRVHPGHARKFAARLEAMGLPYLYYENTDGGHSNDADPLLNARRWALHHVYLSRQLMD
ncbi:S9 family peptidase [Myxococcus sp. AM009]|uniref:prolyl oligopeptidase family serine peptidase n=1 Tax=unclassified Myxococcus TaxID=2648731 RepID=UPI001595E972|nr:MULTISPECIES: prolyl oligopeptidase family serine peptidase [unclassified Myxococcus]NVJ00043.1 S9 family peptidase [Myxococcus sp. AM009]NVJ13436.1 S9 family peptidase [Myxococcus sp. AM010]